MHLTLAESVNMETLVVTVRYLAIVPKCGEFILLIAGEICKQISNCHFQTKCYFSITNIAEAGSDFMIILSTRCNDCKLI